MGNKLLTSNIALSLYRGCGDSKQRHQVVSISSAVTAITAILISMLGATAANATNLTDVNALITQAVATHPLVGSARAEQQATTEGIAAAKYNLYPTPFITSSYQNNNGTVTQAGVKQPLWSGGKLTANVNQAIYDDRAAIANIYQQQNTVAKNTIEVWQSHVYATALQGLYVNDLKQLNEFESMMQRRVDQGVSAKIDLDLVTNRILQDQNAYQGAVQQQRIAEARLSQMIGQPITGTGVSQAMLAQMVQQIKHQSADFEQLAFSEASINNPEVIKQQFQIASARQQALAQKAAQYPTLYAQYADFYNHKTNENDAQFSLEFNYQPGAGFSNGALSRASEARVKSLEQSQEAARRTVMEAIQTQYQQFVSAKDQETSLIAAVAGAQIVVDSYRRQFIAGRKSWLEVLNAVREKTGYQQQLLAVQSQMLGAYYKLAVDFGRMPWQNFAAINTPVEEYRPLSAIQSWIKDKSSTLQPYQDSKAMTVLPASFSPNDRQSQIPITQAYDVPTSFTERSSSYPLTSTNQLSEAKPVASNTAPISVTP